MHHKKNKSEKILRNLLQECFGYYRYKTCITLAKDLLMQPNYSEHWDRIKQLISERSMPVGVPLALIHNEANLPLEEDSDEEAYKWFDLLVRNIETTDEHQIIEY